MTSSYTNTTSGYHTASTYFPVFQRAICEKDEAAWEQLYHQLVNLVRSWVVRFDGPQALLDAEGQLSAIDEAFTKFYRALTPTKARNFTSVAQFLKYLKLCTRSAVLDEHRRIHARRLDISLENVEAEDMGLLATEDPTEAITFRVWSQELWQVLKEELNGYEERLLIACYLQEEMKPRDIARKYPREFCSVEEVYRVHRNVFDRLRRNSRLLELMKQEKGA